jgi:hypothetical protein
LPLLTDGDQSVFNLTKLDQHSTKNHHHQVICCQSIHYCKEISMPSSTLKIHDLLEISLHGAPVRRYSSQEPQRSVTPTQESRTSMEPNPERPYQPRGPYQSRRPRRENASVLEAYAVNSNTIGTEPAKKRHCVSMACMPCRTRRTKVSVILQSSE